ncbi:sensor histidine kinase [Glaciibacter superstes]|uniref:sensor histidine kinase n=1 Tax=Glaciibacter superstes TaxID=501023 RepID=UPI00041800B6|nr:histidine kinase [Glaciibacter superstes]
MTGLLRTAWNAPGAAPPPPRRVWRDWALLAFVVVLAVLETLVRTQFPEPGTQPLTQPLVALAIVLVAAPTLLWRRTRPLLMLVISFGVTGIATLLLGDSQLFTSGYAIFTLYALFRWGNGRALVAGCGIVATNLAVSALTGTLLGDLIGGTAFFTIVVTLALALRFRARARMRELDSAKLMERETLARDLHDTVAHHVSAIAIRAQAGLAVAELHPDAATDALRVIEAEASKTLAEMRSMVRVLRQGDAPELAPGRTLPDISELASDEQGGPRVVVQVSGDADSIPRTVAAAVYRLAQESVTNARRHARGASIIDVVVEADKGGVRLTVTNDGEVAAAATPGYGITGMMERASLLGGTCQSGRAPGGGWVVSAVLPRVGWTT